MSRTAIDLTDQTPRSDERSLAMDCWVAVEALRLRDDAEVPEWLAAGAMYAAPSTLI